MTLMAGTVIQTVLFAGSALAMTLGAFNAGRQRGRAEKRAEAVAPTIPAHTVDPAKLTCGCGHNLAFHDLEAKKCCAKQRTGGYMMSGRDVYGQQVSYEDCPCQGYNGPKPPVDITDWLKL